MSTGVHIRTKPAWNKGRTGVYSMETLIRMGNASRGRKPWNKKGEVIICLICGNKKERKPSKIRNGANYCSYKCSGAARVNKPLSESHKIKIRNANLGELGNNWQGNDVGYHGVHHWVKKHFGKPLKCEHCGTTTARKFEWANKDHKYKRIRADFVRLCTTCHRKYDVQQKIIT